MKPDTLDALVLDRALGELHPASAERLAAHLHRDPDAARRAAVIEDALAAAHAALAGPAPVALPPLRLPVHPTPPPRWWKPRAAWLPLAASLALGLAGGWALRSAHSGPPRGSVPILAALQPAPESRPGFWSVSRWTSPHRPGPGRPPPHPAVYRLLWASPRMQPRLVTLP